MKKLSLVLVVSFVSSLAAPAFADPTPAPSTPTNVKVLKTVTVVGQRRLPSAVIEVTRPTAAHEASVAHEAFRTTLATTN